MLKIYVGEMPDLSNVILNPSLYFKYNYKQEWLTSDLGKQMIKDVDKSDVVGPNLIISPVLGPIAPYYLSGGVKALLIMAFDDSKYIVDATACGDNCAKWILEIAKHKDLIVMLEYAMNFGMEEFEIQILNTGEVVHNLREYVHAVCELL